MNLTCHRCKDLNFELIECLLEQYLLLCLTTFI